MNVSLQLKRLIRLISLIRYKARTRNEIIEKFEEDGLNISNRTFDRIIESVRELGFEIVYNKGFGYKLGDDENVNPDLQIILNLGTLITNHRRLNSLTSNEIIIHESSMRGINYVPMALDAITHNTKLEITYKKYGTYDSSIRIIYPLKLVQTENRWYLVAVNETLNGIRTFGFDRIHDIQQLGKFKIKDIPDKLIDKAELFKYKIGVSEPLFKNEPDKIYEITLAVKDFLIPYIQAKKIHFTQTITNEKNGEFTLVKIRVIPNRDLFKRVARELGDMKIVKPEKLGSQST